MNVLSKILSFLVRETPWFVLLAAVLAYFTPDLFSFVHGDTQTVILGLIMLTMGMTLTVKDFKILASRPQDILIGTVAQYTLMPLIAFTISKALGLSPALTVGLILVGCCPHHYGAMSAQEERFVAARQHLPLKKFFLDDKDYRHSDDEALLIFTMNKFTVLDAIAADLKATVSTCSVMLYHDIFNESEGYLEIFTAGTSKAGAIRELARQVGAERVVVFGDNRNDIAMMQAADHSVAVGNAFDEVKAAASEVICPNTEDSVAHWIEKDLLKGKQ